MLNSSEANERVRLRLQSCWLLGRSIMNADSIGMNEEDDEKNAFTMVRALLLLLSPTFFMKFSLITRSSTVISIKRDDALDYCTKIERAFMHIFIRSAYRENVELALALKSAVCWCSISC